MRRSAIGATLCSLCVLTSCGSLLDKYVDQYGGLIAAKPLNPDIYFTSNGKLPPISLTLERAVDSEQTEEGRNLKITYVVLEAFDSLSKCKQMLDTQGIVSRGIDSDLDLLTTVLTALATAFTPVQTIHALTALALITSGWRNVLDSDLYAKKTSDIIATQIDSSYFSAMTSYIKTFSMNAEDKNKNIYPQLEFFRLALVHRECNIDLALGALAEKAKTPDRPNVTTGTITIDDLKPGKLLPGKIPGGPWTVVSVTPPLVNLREGKSKEQKPYQIENLLHILNSSQ